MKVGCRGGLMSGALTLALAGCSGPAAFMRAPEMSPVGSGLGTTSVETGVLDGSRPRASVLKGAGMPESDMFKDQRIARIGDIVTVNIAINDKATFGNATDRSQAAKANFSGNLGFQLGGAANAFTLSGDAASNSETQGKGNIDRSEQIQVSVAAVVTKVFPNGNLEINGSQEVRVNYELRQLSVAGIVRPSDISRANTVSYDHIAEARISYGGKGRLTDVQQPSWGQQLYDTVKLF